MPFHRKHTRKPSNDGFWAPWSQVMQQSKQKSTLQYIIQSKGKGIQNAGSKHSEHPPEALLKRQNDPAFVLQADPCLVLEQKPPQPGRQWDSHFLSGVKAWDIHEYSQMSLKHRVNDGPCMWIVETLKSHKACWNMLDMLGYFQVVPSLGFRQNPCVRLNHSHIKT